ncbi:hypothetical protein [uncultured Treponema sp.]|uniref:hypothetical protein n=1 Tax=uncultured Treponema sp. TaxID=162155 RepID=UPI0026005982|nr:hypothetical protein [uncultured Treponema sp.]
MKSKKIFADIIACFIILVFLSSCVTETSVYFTSDESADGATLYIDGRTYGTIPTQVRLSNAVWENPDILLKKEGYRDLHTDLKKEIKGVNLVCGLLLWWPSLLWVYGPKPFQYYNLTLDK